MTTWQDRLNGAQVVGDTPDEDKIAAARKALNVRPVKELIDEVDASIPPGWLASGVWPADSYGVLGAAHKAGKTWVVLDLGVAVASAGRWLDRWPCTTPGPVILFCGEGGKRKLIRRLRAIAEHKGVELDRLDVYVSERVPHLRVVDHVAAFRAEMEDRQPVLVAIDPAYLAVRGTQSSSLVDVGEALEEAQHACQATGAALVVSHHFNQTGAGTGAERFSGAGWAEWGRVLVAMSVKAASTNAGGRSLSVLRLELRGDEIADQVHEFRREVWADDPDDIASPMHYRLGDVGPFASVDVTSGRFDEAVDKVIEIVEGRPGVGNRELRGLVGGRAVDVDAAVEHLQRVGRIEVEDQGRGRPKRHWLAGRRLRVVEP